MTNFTGANLELADLTKVDLRCANLRWVNFKGANLEGANFKGANLKNAYYLTIEQLSKVETLYDAKLDEELLNSLRKEHASLFKK